MTEDEQEPMISMPLRRHAELMNELEVLRDRISIYERSGDTVPWEEVKRELGLDEPDEHRERVREVLDRVLEEDAGVLRRLGES